MAHILEPGYFLTFEMWIVLIQHKVKYDITGNTRLSHYVLQDELSWETKIYMRKLSLYARINDLIINLEILLRLPERKYFFTVLQLITSLWLVK